MVVLSLAVMLPLVLVPPPALPTVLPTVRLPLAPR